MKFKRKELMELEDRALKASRIPHQDPLWTRAYLNLADALNWLDAMNTRLSPQAKWHGIDKDNALNPICQKCECWENVLVRCTLEGECPKNPLLNRGINK